jgi:hypothetical protein
LEKRGIIGHGHLPLGRVRSYRVYGPSMEFGLTRHARWAWEGQAG